jgi:RimJ/RimL family protein N-acetyltransferase
MILRPVIFEDWRILLDWRNDPITRENSITTDPVEEKTHIIWLLNSLKNPNRELYILEDNSAPVGTIRSDKGENNKYILSWTISPEHRGKGYGTKMLETFLEGRSGEYLAEIYEHNTSSIRMVEKNGFSLMSTDIPDMPLLFYKKLGKRTDLEIIDEIEAIRAKNNTHWMDAVRLCFELDPPRARKIFQDIKACDARINELTEELAKNE